MKFYRTVAKVRPLPGHRNYYDFQFCYLFIWLYALSSDDAERKAKIIIEQMPQELAPDFQLRSGLESEIYHNQKRSNPAFGEELRAQAESAQKIGLGIYMVACPTGTEEGGIEP